MEKLLREFFLESSESLEVAESGLFQRSLYGSLFAGSLGSALSLTFSSLFGTNFVFEDTAVRKDDALAVRRRPLGAASDCWSAL